MSSRRLGITGGIGSGKSHIAQLFAKVGVPCYDTDSAAKRLIHEDANLRTQIIHLLGNEAYTTAGDYNPAYVATQVFRHQELREQLNAIVHPAVWNDYNEWIRLHQEQNIVLVESALFLQLEWEEWVDELIGVIAPRSIRIQWVYGRDSRSHEAIERIIAAQPPDNAYLVKCHWIIHNDGKQPLWPQVNRIILGDN